MAEQTLAELAEEYAVLSAFIDDEELKIKPYKEAKENMRAAIQAKMAEVGTKSLKTTGGHGLSLATSSSVKLIDAEAFYDFVADEGDFEYLQRRPNVSKVEEYLKEHNVLPPGLEMTPVITLRFTRNKA